MTNLPTQYQDFIHLSRYARWIEEEGRRETWPETVIRYITFFKKRFPKIKGIPWKELQRSIINLEVMPSMRCLMTAGPALDRDNAAGYNCAFLRMDRQRSFDEMLYLLMCGTGDGFSVERQYISQLPKIAEEFHDSPSTIIVNDSKLGWAASFRELVSLLYSGQVPKWDMSKVRPAGERLKTFGGLASGPGPLDDLFRFTSKIFEGAQGRQLNSLEVHDIVCKTAEVVVCGGVRRSALISLSNLTDDRLRTAKTGNWAIDTPYRQLANNSVVYTDKPEVGSYLSEMRNLYESKNGERGIFNSQGARQHVARLGRRDATHDFGINPCSEILLRDRQFCNLTEVIIREGDGVSSIKRKVRVAAILGTLQASLTDFRYLSKKWKENTEEEALLGVSFTGIMDNTMMKNPSPKMLEAFKEVAIKTNKTFAKKIGINPSVATTCIKPSGTVSQLVDSASGIHSRHAPYYIRTVRANNADALTKLMLDQGVNSEKVIGDETTMTLFKFPIKAPDNGNVVDKSNAIEQLERWKLYALHWCEHKPSVTIYVKEDEWLRVFSWVWDNFSLVSGVSFLPYREHIYQQAPYQPILKEEYYKLKKLELKIDWSKLKDYETTDTSAPVPELACVGSECEL